MVVNIDGIFQYCVASAEGPSDEDKSGGPTVRLESQFVPETVLSKDECKEVISLMKQSPDKDTIKKKMTLTFVYHQQSSNILSDFQPFKDIKGLVITCHNFDIMTTELFFRQYMEIYWKS